MWLLSLHSQAATSASVFFPFFLDSRRAFVTKGLSSSSSSVFSDFTSSGLYQIGGWVISNGPAGKRATVKWNPATKVLAGVYLHNVHQSVLKLKCIHSWTTYTTSYGLIKPCWTASCRPRRARFSSSRHRTLNGNAPAFFWTSENTAREFFILSW